ncbi:MAG TPA: DDE-type integrase/transposase/recombinase [Hymenobacter sp.]|jgi:transposase InsO family protein
MTAPKSGASPDKRRNYGEAFKAEALRGALAMRRPPTGLVVHSDQGSLYTATRSRGLLARHGAQQSMSRLGRARPGNCYDNAPPGTT